MPDKETTRRARRDLREGKEPSTAAGEFVREEIHHIREGKHGARSAKQAIAIGLSKARRAGVPLKPPRAGRVSQSTRESAERAHEVGQGKRTARAPSKRRGRAITRALKRAGRAAASKRALSRQAKTSARARRGTATSSRRAARKAVATKRRAGTLATAARKAARTRARKVAG